MFNFLKEKLSSWTKKIVGTGKIIEIREKKKAVAEKPKGREKLKIDKRKRTGDELKEERELGGKIIEDIKIEKGTEEIKAIATLEDAEKSIEMPAEEEKLGEEKPKERIKKAKKGKTGFFGIFKKFKTLKLDDEQFNSIFEELELSLIENNTAMEAIGEIKKSLKEKLVGKEIEKNEAEDEIKKGLKESFEKLLIEPFDLVERIRKKDGIFVIVFFGINGSGKTTAIAKLAHLLKKSGISCVLAAADTFRAASIEQIQKHADNLGVKVIKHNYGADPAAVAFDAIKHAQANSIKAVLIDTAGRMHTKDNLLKEMEKICRVAKPDLKIFVGESITGNDIIEQVRSFNEMIGIDGIILTKTDVDEKGGAAISVGYVTQKPILFLGTGQKYEDLEKFSREKIIKGLGF